MKMDTYEDMMRLIGRMIDQQVASGDIGLNREYQNQIKIADARPPFTGGVEHNIHILVRFEQL